MLLLVYIHLVGKMELLLHTITLLTSFQPCFQLRWSTSTILIICSGRTVNYSNYKSYRHQQLLIMNQQYTFDISTYSSNFLSKIILYIQNIQIKNIQLKEYFTLKLLIFPRFSFMAQRHQQIRPLYQQRIGDLSNLA